MKKLFALTLAAILLLALAACGAQPAANPNLTTDIPTSASKSPATTEAATKISENKVVGQWGYAVIIDDSPYEFLDVEFTSDNKVTFMLGINASGYGGDGSGTYSIQGNEIHLDLTAEIGDEDGVEKINMPGIVTYELQGNNLILYPVEGNKLKACWFDFLESPERLVLTKDRSIYDYW